MFTIVDNHLTGERRYFIYDLAGKLIGEYDENGDAISE